VRILAVATNTRERKYWKMWETHKIRKNNYGKTKRGKKAGNEMGEGDPYIV
jgi:hypothetical protein